MGTALAKRRTFETVLATLDPNRITRLQDEWEYYSGIVSDHYGAYSEQAKLVDSELALIYAFSTIAQLIESEEA